MERRKISRPRSEHTESVHPTRRQSIMPTGMRHPEIVQPANPEPEIAETPVPSSKPNTEARKRRPRFDETHSRVTVYLENGILSKVRLLYDEGSIPTLSSMFNDAIGSYLSDHFGV